MRSKFGRRPSGAIPEDAVAPCRVRCTGLLLCGFLLIAAGPLPARTAPAHPLYLAEAERLALADEAGARALEARSSALAAEAKAAEALPVPTLRVGLNNYPIERGDFSTEGMTSAGVTLRQAFPPAGARDLREKRLDWMAQALRWQGADRNRVVRLEVRRAWLDLYLGQRSQALLREARPLFEDLLEVTRSLYAVGRKSQQDVLRAELELGRLADRQIEAERVAAEALATLIRWTGPLASPRLPETLPELPPVPDDATLADALEAHPRLRAAEAQLEADHRTVNLAETERKPGWALDLGYAYREGELPNGEPRSDFVTVGLSMELPFLRRQAVDDRLRSALQSRDASAWERDNLRRELLAGIETETARWRDLGRRITLYDRTILPNAAATAAAAKQAYQSDAADFADVMRAAIDELDARLERLRLAVQRAQSQAALAYLGGLGHDA